MTKKDRTEVELKEDEVALVTNSKGDIKIYLAPMEDEDDVPEHVKFMTALATVCTTDAEVIELIWDRFNDMMRKAN